ncbi:MAG: LutC/YkgG family protein [Pseudomonadota bacterium]
MTEARQRILDAIRGSLARGALAPALALDRRLTRHDPGPIPARAKGLDRARLVDLFEKLASEVGASLARVPGLAAVPPAVADYLARHNLPADIAAAPDPLLDRMPWAARPLLRLRRGRATAADAVSLGAALAALAETGTLMLASGPTSPSTLNFLPDTHIVVLPVARVVGPMEDALKRLRAAGEMPRTVNFITGPSSTGDIEQRIYKGAHGPRRLHIVIVEDETLD